MRIERSAEVMKQMNEAMALRAKLIGHLTASLAPIAKPKKPKTEPPGNSFLRTIVLSAEGFTPLITSTPLPAVDRACSMFAGPFFTSAAFPIPSNSAGSLLPIVQLDLREIGQLANRQFGDGLLQLWCDPSWDNESRGLVRLLPREDVADRRPTAFSYVLNADASDSPVNEDFIFDPAYGTVRTICGYESVGLQCQGGYLDVYAEEITEEIWTSIEHDISRFIEVTEHENTLHIFGSFYPIQYSAANVDMECLVHFPRWGSDGNAQLLYREVAEGEMVFAFMESLR